MLTPRKHAWPLESNMSTRRRHATQPRQDSTIVLPGGPGSAGIMLLTKAENLPRTPAAGVSCPQEMCRTTGALPPNPRHFAH